MGQLINRLHVGGIIHGDLTTSNILMRFLINDKSTNFNNYELVLIDFGLTQITQKPKEKGVDLYVLERAIRSTHHSIDFIMDKIIEGYLYKTEQQSVANELILNECKKNKLKTSVNNSPEEVIRKYKEIRLRGRKRDMIG